MSKGKLYLLPCPIADDTIASISDEVKNVIDGLSYFIVENARTSRRFIKELIPTKIIQELTIFEMPRDQAVQDFSEMKSLLDEGKSIGILSEAGNPCIADPGNKYVSYAHRIDIDVVPLSGPSSILMALIASGFNGQNFTFHGYLPNKKPDLEKRLKQIESQLLQSNYTQIFMDTPYRNEFLIEACTQVFKGSTLMSVGCNLGSKDAFIKTMKCSDWKNFDKKVFHKKPAIISIGN